MGNAPYIEIMVFPPSDVPAPASSQKPGQARPKKAKPSPARLLAWDGFWPGLKFYQAKAGGLGHGLEAS